MNSAYYCDHVCCWNKDYCQTFAIYRKMTFCFSRMEHQHTVHATLLLTCTPMCWSSLNRKTGLQQSGSRSCELDLFSVDSVATDGISSHRIMRISDTDQLKRANWLLDSAKPGHIELSDQSAAKKDWLLITAKGANVKFCLDKYCVQMTVGVIFTECSTLS